MCVLANILFHLVPYQWLSGELDRSKLANSLVNKVLCRVLLVDKSLSQVLWSLNWSGRQVSHLLHLNILKELCPRQRKVRCKLLDASLLGNLNLIALERLLLSLVGFLVVLKSVMVVGTQIGD